MATGRGERGWGMRNKLALPALIVVVGLLIMAWLLGLFRTRGHYDDPRKWNASYRHTDDLPLGMALFDSVMTHSLPQGYQYRRMKVEEACRCDSAGPITLMFADDEISWSYEESEMLLAFVRRGNNLLLVADDVDTYQSTMTYTDDGGLSTNLFSTLDLSMTPLGGYKDFNFSNFKDSLATGAVDSLRWTADGKTFHMPPQMVTTIISTSNTRNRVVADVKVVYMAEDEGTMIEKDEPVLIQRQYGKGRVVLAANSLCFTNFGVLHPEISAYVGRTMALVADKPVIRFTKVYPWVEREVRGRSESPLKFLLAQRPTRWALFVALAALLLFFVFRARRRQRVMPVVPEPENKSVELAQVLGTIYFRRGDHRDLLNKKFRYFAYEVRRRYFVDVADPTRDGQTAAALSSVSSLPAEQIKRQLQVIRAALEPADTQLDKDQLVQYIDFMNKVMSDE